MISAPKAIEPLYVIDTHALIWYLRGDDRLSPLAQVIFRAAERGQTLLIIPVIVMAELYFANAKFKWFTDYASVHREILNRSYFRVLPIEDSHILEFDLDQRVPEMHDRIITGVGRRLGAPVISSDPSITASQLVTVAW